MPLDDLPQPIKDEIFRFVNNQEYEPAPNTYSLTDLLYCLRRSYFKKMNPKPIASLKQAFNLYRGQIFDNLWTKLFKRNQVRCTHRLRSVPITISGKYDFLDEHGILTDLKMPRTLFYVGDQPSEEYAKQIRFYAFCNALDKAQILYIDGGDCKKILVEVGDCTELLKEIEEKATLLYWAIQRGKPPQQKGPEWLCNECQYQNECTNEE